MGAIPTATECRNHLEGYNITTSIISDAWVEEERDYVIVPFVESIIKTSLSSETTATEYYSGNGTDIIILNRRGNINSIDTIEFVDGADIVGSVSVQSVELINNEGIIKSKTNLSEGMVFTVFPKGNHNIKITYKYGNTIEDDVELAIKKLVCNSMLGLLEG